jgi:hypothetical protein
MTDTSKKAIEHCTAPLDAEARGRGYGTHIAADLIRSLAAERDQLAEQLATARNDALAEMSRMIKAAILGGKVGAGDGNTHYLRKISTSEVDNIELALRAQAAPTSVQKVHESQEATSMQNLHESPLPQAYEARGREVWRLGAWHDEDDTYGPVDFCLCTVSEAAYDPKDDAQKIADLLNAHAAQNSLQKTQTIQEEQSDE